MVTHLNVDQETYDLLKPAYEKARDNGNDEFIFMDARLNTGYAKYLLEYMEGILKRHEKT